MSLKKYWPVLILIALFVLVAGIRISLAYQSPLPDYSAFEELRQVDAILETGKPLFDDSLSFGGRTHVFSPVYAYLLAFFGLFLPKLWLVKVIPNVFAAAIVFPAFGIGKHITKKRGLALIGAGMTGLAPATFFVSINDASSLMLSITLLVAAVFFFMKSKNSGKYFEWLIATCIGMILLAPISIVFLLGLALYVILTQVLQVKTSGKDVEIVLFTLFFYLWFSMVIYKKAFVMHGASVIWQNIPVQALSEIFSRITLLQAIAGIGLVTLVLGAYALYDGIVHAQRKPLLLVSGMVLASGLLLWFKLISLRSGLALVSVFLAIVSVHSIFLFRSYVEKTKAARFAMLSVFGIVFIFLLVGLPVLASPKVTVTPTLADVEMFSWAKDNLPEDAIILASPVEGAMIASIAKRGTVIDSSYLLVPRAQERYLDVQSAYTSFFKTEAISVMQKYGATHIYISVQTKAFTGVLLPNYIDDDCFVLVRDVRDKNGFKSWLYERTCSVRGEE